MKLSEEPSNAISERYPAYRRFAEFMQQFVSNKTEDVWDRMAFTDYLQFFSPTTQTKKEYLTPRDFDAFIETLRDLQPDVVISWGTAIVEKIREENPYVGEGEKKKLQKKLKNFAIHLFSMQKGILFSVFRLFWKCFIG